MGVIPGAGTGGIGVYGEEGSFFVDGRHRFGLLSRAVRAFVFVV